MFTLLMMDVFIFAGGIINWCTFIRNRMVPVVIFGVCVYLQTYDDCCCMWGVCSRKPIIAVIFEVCVPANMMTVVIFEVCVPANIWWMLLYYRCYYFWWIIVPYSYLVHTILAEWFRHPGLKSHEICKLLTKGCWFTPSNNLFLQLWKLTSY